VEDSDVYYDGIEDAVIINDMQHTLDSNGAKEFLGFR